MKTMKIVAFLALALSMQQKALSQGNAALLAQIESSIVKTEPKWKLVRKPRTKKGDYVGFEWKSGKSTVFVFVAFYGSAEDAAKGLRNLPGLFEEGGLIMTVLPTTIPNLGEGSYTWKDCCDKRFTGVDFRKGKVVVHVNAPSIEIAKRFASHIAEVIAANPPSVPAAPTKSVSHHGHAVSTSKPPSTTLRRRMRWRMKRWAGSFDELAPQK